MKMKRMKMIFLVDLDDDYFVFYLFISGIK